LIISEEDVVAASDDVMGVRMALKNTRNTHEKIKSLITQSVHLILGRLRRGRLEEDVDQHRDDEREHVVAVNKD
jgi:hypothetical protein